jgi:hypothetical protein
LSPARDPRIAPRVGDEIARNFTTAKQGIILRKVTRAHGGFVFFMRDNDYVAKPKIASLTQWQQWARNAEIVQFAEEDSDAA